MDYECFACHYDGDQFIGPKHQPNSTHQIKLCGNCIMRCINSRNAQTLIDYQVNIIKGEIQMVKEELQTCR